MCGRITVKVSSVDLREILEVVRGLESYPDWTPQYNVPPSAIVPCIRQTAEGRELFPAKWGLIPSWSKDDKRGQSIAKAETVDSKPMFRAAFKARRCVVVASGFYEWREINSKQKQPHYVTLKSGEPMPIAGLWERWHGPDGNVIESCTICTVEPNSLMARLRDRMPVILPHAMIEPWLDPAVKDPEKLKPILSQYPSAEMQEWEVSADVGSTRNQGAYLCEPLSGVQTAKNSAKQITLL